MAKMGRPSTYNPKTAKAICTLVARGLTIRKICKIKSLPSKTTLFRWYADPNLSDFRDQYTRARQFQAMAEADEILELADTADKDTAHAIRVRMDARKWRCERFNRAAFGDVRQVNVSGQVDHRHAVLIAHQDEILSDVYGSGPSHRVEDQGGPIDQAANGGGTPGLSGDDDNH